MLNIGLKWNLMSYEKLLWYLIIMQHYLVQVKTITCASWSQYSRFGWTDISSWMGQMASVVWICDIIYNSSKSEDILIEGQSKHWPPKTATSKSFTTLSDGVGLMWSNVFQKDVTTGRKTRKEKWSLGCARTYESIKVRNRSRRCFCQ